MSVAQRLQRDVIRDLLADLKMPGSLEAVAHSAWNIVVTSTFQSLANTAMIGLWLVRHGWVA